MSGLELNLDKTKIVYCKDDDRKGNYENISFDFLGYTFKPRGAKNKNSKYFTSFLLAISDKAQKAIRKEVKSWKLQLKVDKTLEDISRMFNGKIQGWINYYTLSEIFGKCSCGSLETILQLPLSLKYIEKFFDVNYYKFYLNTDSSPRPTLGLRTDNRLLCEGLKVFKMTLLWSVLNKIYSN